MATPIIAVDIPVEYKDLLEKNNQSDALVDLIFCGRWIIKGYPIGIKESSIIHLVKIK